MADQGSAQGIFGGTRAINSLKNEFYDGIVKVLKDFSNTETNVDVYAIVLDCDFDVGVATS